MQQAACELNISVSTLRRRIRQGRVRNRIVPHRGGFAYLVYLPNSRHADLQYRIPAPPQRRLTEASPPDAQIRALESQVQRLAEALARALRTKPTVAPSALGGPTGVNPYSRYRWLARRRRWWPF